MIQKQILDEVKRIMKERGVTQQHLANALNYSQTAVSQLLNSKTSLSINQLHAIATVLKITLAEIVIEASQKAPVSESFSAEIQQLSCKDDVGFQIFNRLKEPLTFVELMTAFPEALRDEVRRRINELREKQIIIEDLDKRLVLNLSNAVSLHYKTDHTYNERIESLYHRLSKTRLWLSQAAPHDLEKWKEKNYDAFFIEYFTDSQIIEQNRILRQAFDFIKQQHRINRFERKKKNEPTKLRVLYAVSAPCPTLKD